MALSERKKKSFEEKPYGIRTKQKWSDRDKRYIWRPFGKIHCYLPCSSVTNRDCLQLKMIPITMVNLASPLQ
jgi:hypothetical protein